MTRTFYINTSKVYIAVKAYMYFLETRSLCSNIFITCLPFPVLLCFQHNLSIQIKLTSNQIGCIFLISIPVYRKQEDSIPYYIKLTFHGSSTYNLDNSPNSATHNFYRNAAYIQRRSHTEVYIHWIYYYYIHYQLINYYS